MAASVWTGYLTEVKVAHQLIEALAVKWQPEKYYDSFQENVKKLIQARLEGKEATPVEKPRKLAPPADLMVALKQSLAEMEGKKKPPQRVPAEQKASGAEAKRGAGARKKPAKKAA